MEGVGSSGMMGEGSWEEWEEWEEGTSTDVGNNGP